MVSFGIKFSKEFAIGLNAKALFQRYNLSASEKYISKGVGADLGLYISNIIIPKLNLGIKSEVYGKFDWNQSISGVGLNYSEKIPLRFVAGFSYAPSKAILVFLQHELMSIDSEKNHISHRLSLGAEYAITYHIPLFFRFGLRQNQYLANPQSMKGLLKPSSGVGCQFKFMNKFLTNLDYAIHIDELGINNLLSISTEL